MGKATGRNFDAETGETKRLHSAVEDANADVCTDAETGEPQLPIESMDLSVEIVQTRSSRGFQVPKSLLERSLSQEKKHATLNPSKRLTSRKRSTATRTSLNEDPSASKHESLNTDPSLIKHASLNADPTLDKDSLLIMPQKTSTTLSTFCKNSKKPCFCIKLTLIVLPSLYYYPGCVLSLFLLSQVWLHFLSHSSDTLAINDQHSALIFWPVTIYIRKACRLCREEQDGQMFAKMVTRLQASRKLGHSPQAAACT